MTLDDLMIEQRVRAQEISEARARYTEEALGDLRGRLGHRVREQIARTLVRLGLWFDRDAGERAGRPAPPRPQGRALWD
jgi:hypothetical protein